MTKRKGPGKGAGIKFEPSPEQRIMVETLHGYGLQLDQLRLLILNPHTGRALSKPALMKHFRPQLDIAQSKANSKVLQTAFRIATDPTHPRGAAMNMFWQKTRMGFKEVQVREHTGPDGGPIKTISDDMTPQQASELYADTLKATEPEA